MFLAPQRVEVYRFPGEDRLVFVRDGFHEEQFLSRFEKLVVSASPLLKAKEDCGVFVQGEQAREGLEEQWEGRLEVDAVSGQDDVGPRLNDLAWKSLSPSA